MKPRSQSGVTLLELLIVLMIIGVIAGVTFPALTAGLSGLRLTSASGSVATFLTSAMDRVERREQTAEIVITPHENKMSLFTAQSGDQPDRVLTMPQGITVEGDEPVKFLLQPGGSAPRVTVFLRNDLGARRSIRIDPTTGVPEVGRL